MENLARRLIADTRDHSPSLSCLDRAIAASDKFRTPLTKLAGTVGFSSLLSRALAVAKRRSVSLGGLQVSGDGRLVLVKGESQKLESDQACQEGAVILITELLSLLVVLIGESLTLGLVREVFPKLSIESTIPNTKEKT